MYEKERFASLTTAIAALLAGLALFHFEFPFAASVGGIGLFILALCLPLRQSHVLTSLRLQSMWIYFTHEYVLFLFFVILSIGYTQLKPFVIMLIVFAKVALLAKALSSLQQKQTFKFLNTLVG